MALKVCLQVSIRKAEPVDFTGVQVCMYVAAYRIYQDSRNWLLWWRIMLEYIILDIMFSDNIY